MAALILILIVAGGFYIGGGWYFSDELNRQALSAAAKHSELVGRVYPIGVLAVDDSAGAGPAIITLRVPADTDELLAPGVWGLEAADGGFGQISTIEKLGNGTISRIYRQLDGPSITAGKNVRLVHQAFPANPAAALGIPYREVAYAGPLGVYPAWFIDGTSSDWAILVHGNSLERADMLRSIAPIHRAGLPVLVITYRNDPNAPQDPSGRLGYGLTEWQDLEAAARFALAHGAHRLVLDGVSMGGGIVMSFLYRSSLATSVAAVVLDSPMLDFSSAVDHGVSNTSLPVIGLPVPGSLVAVAKWMAAWRYGIDWGKLNYLAGDSRLRSPILLFQGTADATVPPSTSSKLATDRPDLVTYVVTPGAGHVDSWNVDPARYERYLQTFVATYTAQAAASTYAWPPPHDR
jgi:fermentation-respiration switch protein FrsA (DUF1100 family)